MIEQHGDSVVDPGQATAGRALSRRAGPHRPPTRQRGTEPTTCDRRRSCCIGPTTCRRSDTNSTPAATISHAQKGQGDDLISVGEAAVLLGLCSPTRAAVGCRPRRSERRPHWPHVGAAQVVGSGTRSTTEGSASWPYHRSKDRRHIPRAGGRTSAPPPDPEPSVEAVMVAIDGYLATLTDEQFFALVERARGQQQQLSSSSRVSTASSSPSTDSLRRASTEMPATASLRDCSALVAATEEAGGRAPEVLKRIINGAASAERPAGAGRPSAHHRQSGDRRQPYRRAARGATRHSSQSAVGRELRVRGTAAQRETIRRRVPPGVTRRGLRRTTRHTATDMGRARGGRRQSTVDDRISEQRGRHPRQR